MKKRYLTDLEVEAIERNAKLGIAPDPETTLILIETLRETQIQNELMRTSLFFLGERIARVLGQVLD